MRTLLITAGAGALFMVAGCGTAAASHTAPDHAAGPSAAAKPATPPPAPLAFTCRFGWINTGP